MPRGVRGAGPPGDDGTAPHADVLIVGAGLAGIGAAWQLQSALPRQSYLIWEARQAIGGTWDLFRYPGVRSDSDMHTLGYRFRPWTSGAAIADGPAILSYLRETAAEAGIDQRIRFGHQAVAASWSSADARWTVSGEHDGQPVTVVCRFLYLCTGYYRYDTGHEPSFPGQDAYRGVIVHPQRWPSGLDYARKRVVVIGSGATAVTLVPAMAADAAHVTMLQRSPSYVLSLPARDKVADGLARAVGPRLAYPVVRWKNIAQQTVLYRLCRRRPAMARALLLKWASAQLPPGYDVGTHFTPDYDPWDQRLCVVPSGDLFRAIRRGRVSVVTGRIASCTPSGVLLESGESLEADVIVTATGLRLLGLGGIAVSVDGREVKLPETMVYKGLMLSDVPNCAFTFGYTNASWTLKADLVAEYVTRLLRYMAARGYDSCVPVRGDPRLTEQPMLDFKSGYVQRSLHEFPKAGSRGPWRVVMSYPRDVRILRYGRVNDGTLRFARLPR